MRKFTIRARQYTTRRAIRLIRRRVRKTQERREWSIPVKQRQVSVVYLWNGQESEKAFCIRRPIKAPRIICLDRNAEETLAFAKMMRKNFQHIREGKYIENIKRKNGKMPRIGSYLDFSGVEYISTAGAVIIASEYQKVKEVSGRIPPAVNLETWSKGAFDTLFGIGFFEAVGLASDESNQVYQGSQSKILKVISVGRRDDIKLPLIGQYISELYEFIHPGTSVPREVVRETLTSISEGITNTLHHAYDEPDADYSPEEKIWITASADRSEGSLTIVLLDHGRGIPVTYPRLELKEIVTLAVDRIAKSSGGQSKDAAYIAAAMRYGRSQTMEPQRGKGLPQMRSLIRRLNHGGSMTVRSNRGWWHRPERGQIRMGDWPESLQGTLIEWTIRLPREQA